MNFGFMIIWFLVAGASAVLIGYETVKSVHEKQHIRRLRNTLRGLQG